MAQLYASLGKRQSANAAAQETGHRFLLYGTVIACGKARKHRQRTWTDPVQERFGFADKMAPCETNLSHLVNTSERSPFLPGFDSTRSLSDWLRNLSPSLRPLASLSVYPGQPFAINRAL